MSAGSLAESWHDEELMTSDPSVTARVRSLLRESLKIEAASDQTDLIETGVLDSLALVELLFAIEGEFQLTLAVEELDVADFRSVESIGELIARSRVGS